MADCLGLADDHCCYIGGEVCSYLEEGTVAGRRWVCGLLRELGSWARVYGDGRYDGVRVKLRARGMTFDCGDWPGDGDRCASCGLGMEAVCRG